MYKKWLLAVILLIIPVALIANHAFSAISDENEAKVDKTNQSTLRYSSSQFTKPEPEASKIVQENSFEDYMVAAENDEMILYVNEDSLAIKLQNKDTGYVWNSGLDHPENYRLNNTWEQFVQSAVSVDYLDRQGKLKTESILTNDSSPDIELTDNGFIATIFLFQAKVEFQLQVEMEGNELVVTVPQESIKEDKYTKLITMQIYPFLGAVHQNDIPGYMFIPDGSGALIRFDKSKKSAANPFVGSIYGPDEGIKTRINTNSTVVPPEKIQMPVFGSVHGAEQNGYLAIVENGSDFADIVAYPAGATTDFNRVASQFHYRHDYFQPTSKNRQGVYIYQDDLNEVHAKLRYVFLSNEEADYVGMAKTYRDYLIENGELVQQEDQVDVRLEFLGGESESGLLWDSVIPMTPIDEIPGFVTDLKNNGVENLSVVYKGWSKGGLSSSLPDKFPFENALGSQKDVKNTIETLMKQDVPVYFHADYTRAFEGASGYSNKDIAKKLSSENISNRMNGLTYFYLSPDKSLKIVKADLEQYEKYGIQNVAVDTTGYTLFSDYNKSDTVTREETREMYQELFVTLQENVGPTALYEPNVYTWKNTQKYFDIPMNTSNYMYETDTVPFIQIVLKGNLPYYAPFSNFNSNPEDQLLRMVEYGAYPSFLLTKEPSHLLAETFSSDVYTSEFDIWREDIIHQFSAIKEGLGQVEGATIEDRYVPATGVVEVTYSNGKTIIVNYNNTAYVTEDYTVSENSFLVMEREGE